MSRKRQIPVLDVPQDEFSDFKGGMLIESRDQLPFVDKIRLLFGSKLYYQTTVRTRYRTGPDPQIETTLYVEQVVNSRKVQFKNWLRRKVPKERRTSP